MMGICYSHYHQYQFLSFVNPLDVHISCCTAERHQFRLNSDFVQTRVPLDKLTSVTSPEDMAVFHEGHLCLKLRFLKPQVELSDTDTDICNL